MDIKAGNKFAGRVTIALCAVWLIGCGSDGDDGGGVDMPTLVEKAVGPGGGSVTSGDGRLTLSFPPGALPAENTIVIETLDPDNPPAPFASRDDVGTAYDLRPDGMTFDQPVTVTFNIGEDPTPDDGSIRVPVAVLATQGTDGLPETLANLVSDVDPDTGLTRVTGELNHFTPLVASVTGGVATLTVTGVPEQSLATNETFTASARVDFDTGQSNFISALESARYSDRSFDPIVCQLQDCEEVPLQMTGSADGAGQFATDIDYGCKASGTGRYAADVDLDATATNGDTFQIRLEVDRLPLECVAPDSGGNSGGGDDGQATIGFTFEDVTAFPQIPGPPLVLPADFELFDFSAASEFFAAALSDDGNLYGYDDGLNLKDSIFLDLDLRFGSAWWQAPFTDSTGSASRRDGIFLAGADGLAFTWRNDAGFRVTERLDMEGNVTDILAASQLGVGYAVNFTQGRVDFYSADPGTGTPVRDETNSGLINNNDVGGHFLVSGYLPYPPGFDDPGDKALALTTRGPNGEPGRLWQCTRTEDGGGQPAANCTEGPVVGANAQHLRCAEPNAEGDTVCAAPAFDDQTVLIVGWNIFGGPIVPIGTLDNAQTVTPAVQRDGEDVVVVATDADEDAVVAASVDAEGMIETAREDIPPVEPGSGLEPIQARGPVHVINPIDQLLGFIFATEASNTPDTGTLFVGAIFALGGEE